MASSPRGQGQLEPHLPLLTCPVRFCCGTVRAMKITSLRCLPLLLLAACSPCQPKPPATQPDASALSGGTATLTVKNDTKADAVLYVAFGADSEFTPADWPSCTQTSALNCTLALKAKSSHEAPLAGQYANLTMAFNAAPGCGSTKAEANLNNPSWYDTTDISLVDGFNEQVMMTVTDSTGEKKLGPVIGAEGNEDNFGVFPLGCDGCALRIDPPCGQSAGGPGCHGGTQYDPKPVCQYQSGAKGGSSAVVVMLIDAVPAKP